MGLELSLHALFRPLEVGLVYPSYLPPLILLRLCRKTFHQPFNMKQVDTYQPVQPKASVFLLRSMLDAPEEFFGHVRQ